MGVYSGLWAVRGKFCPFYKEVQDALDNPLTTSDHTPIEHYVWFINRKVYKRLTHYFLLFVGLIFSLIFFVFRLLFF